jgi:hypothetical protein
MVEIIIKGSLPDDNEYTTDCTHCQTKFRFKRFEAAFVADQRDGNALVIPCPLCHRDVWAAT